ncbi:MAG: hypothetical protein V3T60_13540 [Candidatus Binatia bacterium]
MPFKRGNQEWRKRRANRGGRPSREHQAKRDMEAKMRFLFGIGTARDRRRMHKVLHGG